MSIIRQPQWTEQPQELVKLDASHPFAQQALTVVIPVGPGVYEAATETSSTNGAVGITAALSPSGKALLFNTGTAGSRYRLPSNPRRVTGFGASNADLHKWTRIHLVTPSATGVFQLLSTSGQTTDGSAATGITCRVSTTGTLAFEHAGVASLAVTSNAIPWTIGQPVCIVVRHDGTSFVAYVNGRRFTCGSYSVSSTPGPGMYGIWLGREDSDSTRFSGRYSFFADSKYLVTDDEGISLSLNPWQIFEPRHVFVPAAITSGSYTITADNGTYSVAGQTATINKSRILTANQGSYTYTGQAATLLRNKVLVGAQGSYSITGQSATLLRSKQITADQGTYSISGQNATISYSGGPTNYSLTADQGTYTYTGQSATLARNKLISASSGTYALSGQAATVAYSGSNIITLKAGSWIRYRIIT